MSTRNFIVVAVGALLVAVGCGLHPGEAWNRTDGAPSGGIGSTSGGTTTSGDDVTDQSQQGLCPTSSPLLTARHAAGDVCTSPSDCVSTCCDCGTGSESWLAASCVAGRCADSVTSCSRTTARYCGNGGIIVAPVPGGGSACTGGTTACDACINASCCAESRAAGTRRVSRWRAAMRAAPATQRAASAATRRTSQARRRWIRSTGA